jgi:hypothetical protein
MPIPGGQVNDIAKPYHFAAGGDTLQVRMPSPYKRNAELIQHYSLTFYLYGFTATDFTLLS